ncbi:cell division protein FtsW, partial [PVC group bacterium]|nr:cell division protein FtsW [PVC group bacterium]
KDKISLFWNGLCPPLFIMGLLVGMVLLQPDFGTMVLMSAVSILMLFVGGALLRYLGALFIAVLPALYLAVWNVPYRRQRVMTFLDPWNDPGGSGYQVIQSLVALGSGGLFGVGLGQSRQKLFYLPEAHTDFIFSIIGEEIGLIGSLSIIVIFLYLFWNGLMIVWNTKDPFGYYLGLGIVSLICLQTFIHIGVVTNSLPPKGIPLPFISFGGSSLVINMISMGILISIGKHQPGYPSKRRRKLSTF